MSKHHTLPVSVAFPPLTTICNTLCTSSAVNDVTFAHNSAYGDSTFRSWVNLIRQRAPALYTFILKRLRTAQVSAVAVVIFANDCVPGAKSAILDFLKFQCSRNKNVQNANVVTIVVINIFTMLRPKRDWTKYRTSLCYCTLCIYKALDVYSVTIAIVTLNDTVLNTTYIVGLFRETSSAKLGKTEFTLRKIRLQSVAEVKHCTVRCVAHHRYRIVTQITVTSVHLHIGLTINITTGAQQLLR